MKDLSFIESMNLAVESAKQQANKAIEKSTQDVNAIAENLAMLENMLRASRSKDITADVSDGGSETPMGSHIGKHVEHLSQLASALTPDPTSESSSAELLKASSLDYLGKCCFLFDSISNLRTQLARGVTRFSASTVQVPDLEATEALALTALGFSGEISITKESLEKGHAAEQSMAAVIEELIATCSEKVKEVRTYSSCSSVSFLGCILLP